MIRNEGCDKDTGDLWDIVTLRPPAGGSVARTQHRSGRVWKSSPAHAGESPHWLAVCHPVFRAGRRGNPAYGAFIIAIFVHSIRPSSQPVQIDTLPTRPIRRATWSGICVLRW